MLEHCRIPCLGSSPVLRDSGREAGSNSLLYPPVSEMLLTQILLLAAPGALCLSGKQKINPKNQTLITPGGEGWEEAGVEVLKGGVWPDLVERNRSLLGQEPLKFQISSLFSWPLMTGQQEGWRKPKSSENLPGAPPQAIFPHPWGSRTPAREPRALAGSANLHSSVQPQPPRAKRGLCSNACTPAGSGLGHTHFRLGPSEE